MSILLIILLVAFVVALALGHFAIPVLRRLAGQKIREDGPESHKKKAGTPSMGGLFIMASVLVAMFILIGRIGRYGWFAVIGSFAYGIVGFLDDLVKALKHRNLGLTPWQKILLQVVFGLLISLFAYFDPQIGSTIYIPLANTYLDLGIFFIPFCLFFLLAVTNSVNLTDGLDGLAGGISVVNTATYAMIFLGMLLVNEWVKDMMLFAAAVTGAILGFLRYNTYPAKVIMGDTGSFFLGGAISMMAIVSKTELLIPLMGVMFLATTISCILQIVSYKTRRKRIFRMAPLHHHFELGGTPETKIVSNYMLITIVACLLTLLMLSYT